MFVIYIGLIVIKYSFVFEFVIYITIHKYKEIHVIYIMYKNYILIENESNNFRHFYR